MKKNSSIISAAMPIIKNKKRKRCSCQGCTYSILHGSRQIGVSINLDDVIEDEGKSILVEMQKIVALGMIDFNWKEH